MQELQEIFEARKEQKRQLHILVERQKAKKTQKIIEKSKIKQWETGLNSDRLNRKRNFSKLELQVKLKQYEVKVDKFKRDKQMVMVRAQYNLLCQHMRKSLLEDRFREMEQRKNFNQTILRKIDHDFLAMLVDENDEEMDETLLQSKYIELFNLLAAY